MGTLAKTDQVIQVLGNTIAQERDDAAREEEVAARNRILTAVPTKP